VNENEEQQQAPGAAAEAGNPSEQTRPANGWRSWAPTGFAWPGTERRRVVAAMGALTLVTGGGIAAGLATSGRGGTSTAGKTAPAGNAVTHLPTQRPKHSASPSPTPTPTHTLPVASAPQFYVDGEGAHAIALTMDDGPHPVYTPQVLEVLRHYNVKATFNMIGEQVGANLSLVREVSAAGHTITNHTWNHADMRHYSDAKTLSEIDRCNEALAAAGQHPTIFRAPFGYWTPAVFRACAARALRPVAWSVDPDDWDTAHVDTQDIVHNVLTHTHAHSIILEHDGGGVRRNTVAALKIFIPALLERGYTFVAM
jgi:peptidoglycan/xylan/chitin deacetylase (PgdA/CDA1 family)